MGLKSWLHKITEGSGPIRPHEVSKSPPSPHITEDEKISRISMPATVVNLPWSSVSIPPAATENKTWANHIPPTAPTAPELEIPTLTEIVDPPVIEFSLDPPVLLAPKVQETPVEPVKTPRAPRKPRAKKAPPAKAVVVEEATDDKVQKSQSDKAWATAAGEPWVNVLGIELDADRIGTGSFELDWNEIFVNRLRTAGYKGKKDTDVVDQWFMDLCKNIVLESYEQEMADPDHRRERTNRRTRDDGRTEVS